MPIGISVYATVDLSQAKYSNHDRKTGVSPITILTSTSSCLKFTKKHISSPRHDPRESSVGFDFCVSAQEGREKRQAT